MFYVIVRFKIMITILYEILITFLSPFLIIDISTSRDPFSTGLGSIER